MARKASTTIRITEEARATLKALADKLGISQAAVMEIAIRKLHQQEIKTMSIKYDYSVIEDNGGGLHLFVFKAGKDKPVAAFSGFEYTKGSLIESLDGLDKGEDMRGWEGKAPNAQEFWDSVLASEYGYATICYRVDGERTIEAHKMGRAGQIEFDIETA